MRKNSHVGFGKSFDSFLSIVTKNGLGVLILIAMASTFANVQTLGEAKFRRNLGTPIIKHLTVTPDMRFVSFECRGGKIFPVDSKAIASAEINFFSQYESFFSKPVTLEQHEVILSGHMTNLAKQFNDPPITNDYYVFEFLPDLGFDSMDEELKHHFKKLPAAKKIFYPDVAAYKKVLFPKEPAVRFNHKPNPKSEDMAEALKPDSVFRKGLEAIHDKKTGVVSLRVWPDSFPFFRELRDWLTKEGYLINWSPVDKPVVWRRPGPGSGKIPIIGS